MNLLLVILLVNLLMNLLLVILLVNLLLNLLFHPPNPGRPATRELKSFSNTKSVIMEVPSPSKMPSR